MFLKANSENSHVPTTFSSSGDKRWQLTTAAAIAIEMQMRALSIKQEQDQPPLARASVGCNERVFITESEAVQRPARIAWLGLLREFGNILQVLFIGRVNDFPGSFVVAAR
jgi:hypothetical protein